MTNFVETTQKNKRIYWKHRKDKQKRVHGK